MSIASKLQHGLSASEARQVWPQVRHLFLHDVLRPLQCCDLILPQMHAERGMLLTATSDGHLRIEQLSFQSLRCLLEILLDGRGQLAS